MVVSLVDRNYNDSMFNIKRYSIMKILLDNVGEEVSGEFMSKKLVISRAAIAKHIKNMRNMGCTIQARPGGGYTMKRVPNLICEELIRVYGKDILPVRMKDVVKSTNIDAKDWAEHGGEHGSILVAKTQTAGRGRRQREWQSVEGGIWFSLILKLDIVPSQVQPVTISTAMAVSQSIIQNCSTANPKIKWPNDILVNGKKVCGILTEFVGDIDELKYLIVGIGINNYFDSDRLDESILHTATTLKSEGIIINSSKLIANVRDNLLSITKKWSDTKSTAHIKEFYREHMAYRNEEIKVLGGGHDFSGILKDIDENGALIISTKDGEKKIVSGEISVRKV